MTHTVTFPRGLSTVNVPWTTLHLNPSSNTGNFGLHRKVCNAQPQRCWSTGQALQTSRQATLLPARHSHIQQKGTQRSSSKLAHVVIQTPSSLERHSGTGFRAINIVKGHLPSHSQMHLSAVLAALAGRTFFGRVQRLQLAGPEHVGVEK